MNGKTLSLDDRQEIKSVIENVKYISKGDNKTKEETEDLGIVDMFKGRYLKTTLITLLNWVEIFQIQCPLDITTDLRQGGWGRYRQRGRYIMSL